MIKLIIEYKLHFIRPKIIIIKLNEETNKIFSKLPNKYLIIT